MNQWFATPVGWRDFVEQYAGSTKARVDRLASASAGYDTLSGARLCTAMTSCDGVLAGGIALCGPGTVREFARAHHPHISRVVDDLRTRGRLTAPIVHWMLNFALIAECMGVPRPQGFDAAALKPLLAARAEFSDARQRSMAFTSLALGDTATALAFVDEKPAQYDAPVARVEFNQLELIRYLAATLDARRPADWIEPTWVEHFHLFPLHLEAEAAEWPDLFNFARVLANVRGEIVSTIADDVHARVMRAARSQA